MKKNIITVMLSVAFLVLAGGFYFTSTNSTEVMIDNNDVMIREQTGDPLVKNDETMVKLNSGYVAYSPDYLNKHQGKKKVLFFHANWCPTCIAADREINEGLASIPDDLVILKTNYDTESELKKKYGITYQHTFVLVDDEGNELDKWNGGSLTEILERI
ncbi:MAG: thioredoxin family protein [Candidatus Pacebacteria bacterium]|nr:thioredoxin family protein [Candidatus Paceibacterota bacterium]